MARYNRWRKNGHRKIPKRRLRGPKDFPPEMLATTRYKVCSGVGPVRIRKRRRHLRSQWAETDPKGATDYALTLPPADGQHNLLSEIASTLAQSDPALAMAWAAQLPNDKAREAAIPSIVSQWAESDAASAAKYVAT